MKKPLKIILIILAVLVGLVAALLIWLTATQLNVKTETAVVTNGENSTASFAPGDSVSILTWNVGYAGLGEESDFFMDGGKQVRAPSKAIVEKNMDGIVSTVKELDADFTFLQEIEADPSTRSYGIEEAERMRTETGLDTAHARNYKCAFVPYPIPPIGKVSSGIMTLSTAPIASAERIALPSPFKWPVSVANLKRCLMPVYIDLEGTDAQLVLVNLHLEAYDDGEGKAAQTAALKSFLEQEYAKGNYVIAGGDFNQTFPGGLDKYPIKNADLWTPGTLDDSMLPDGWHFASFAPGDSVSILTWNVGYAGLGEESDFFMDGGKQVRAPSKAIVEKNMDGIVSTVKELDADFTFLQEIEADPSTRSYGIEEAERMRTETGLDTAHARNYKCAFVPYPIPPIGKVSSGIMTLSTAPIASAERIALPSPFKWPVSVANLKRCLMPVYIDLEGTDAQLVLVNLHLEAYDDGEGKAAQTAALKSFLEQEYAKGNYVIAGGDFNQTFPGGLDKYPIKNADLWTPGTLDDSMLPDGWHFAYDTATPTCRLDNQPYDAESDATQHYVIDGFILSPNVELTGVQTQDDGFRFSDHNPVLLNIRLK